VSPTGPAGIGMAQSSNQRATWFQEHRRGGDVDDLAAGALRVGTNPLSGVRRAGRQRTCVARLGNASNHSGSAMKGTSTEIRKGFGVSDPKCVTTAVPPEISLSSRPGFTENGLTRANSFKSAGTGRYGWLPETDILRRSILRSFFLGGCCIWPGDSCRDNGG
jgi:hypothetical protein